MFFFFLGGGGGGNVRGELKISQLNSVIKSIIKPVALCSGSRSTYLRHNSA